MNRFIVFVLGTTYISLIGFSALSIKRAQERCHTISEFGSIILAANSVFRDAWTDTFMVNHITRSIEKCDCSWEDGYIYNRRVDSLQRMADSIADSLHREAYIDSLVRRDSIDGDHLKPAWDRNARFYYKEVGGKFCYKDSNGMWVPKSEGPPGSWAIIWSHPPATTYDPTYVFINDTFFVYDEGRDGYIFLMTWENRMSFDYD